VKIVVINGSQKTGESNTGIILAELNRLFTNTNEVVNLKLDAKLFSPETYRQLALSDAIVFAFPLYTDSLPSNTLKLLVEAENYFKKDRPKDAVVYTIINNGFYEGRQTHIAFEVMQNWCEHTGLRFGGGIGQGAGEMLGATRNMPVSKGPFNNLGRALKVLVEKIESRETFQIMYLSPYFPRFLWRLAAEQSFWLPLAYKNKLTKKDILRRLP
jgi:multimeric flavodoxin WrbA